jgi:uncharacterized damage-inducible protein DinB
MDMSITPAAHYRMFGHYNAWANGRLYASPGPSNTAASLRRRSSSSNWAPALAHWFNHQSHHRGQVHALLTGLVGEAPELDLLFFQRLSAKPAA